MSLNFEFETADSSGVFNKNARAPARKIRYPKLGTNKNRSANVAPTLIRKLLVTTEVIKKNKSPNAIRSFFLRE